VGSNLGYYKPAFYPEATGKGYTPSALLAPLAAHQNNFTVFSGLDHRAGNGHKNWDNFLCGKKAGDFSLDQMVAEHTSAHTRIPSLQLCEGALPGIQKMSYTREGGRVLFIKSYSARRKIERVPTICYVADNQPWTVCARMQRTYRQK
jgi:hypothetical protein